MTGASRPRSSTDWPRASRAASPRLTDSDGSAASPAATGSSGEPLAPTVGAGSRACGELLQGLDASPRRPR